MGLCTIKRSSEFQRLRGGLRVANASFVIESRPRKAMPVAAALEVDPQRAGKHADQAALAAIEGSHCPRFGFTVTRKIGNAVIRNRIRRRFKEALRLLEPGIIAPGHDYVVIARPGVIEQPFADLKQLLATCITGLHRPRPADAGRAGVGRAGAGKHRKNQSGNSQHRHPSKPTIGESKPDR